MANRHLKDRHSAGAEQTRIADFGDDGRHLAGAEFGNATGIQAVFIAERQVMQEIVNGFDALGGQNFGEARANAFHELNWGAEFKHRS